MMLLTVSDNFTGILQFLTVVVIFVIVLGITLLATRWISNYQKGTGGRAANIELVETYRLTTNKYVQILRIGGKYLAIAIGKDEVHLLAELDGAEIRIDQDGQQALPDFATILARFKKPKDSGMNNYDDTASKD